MAQFFYPATESIVPDYKETAYYLGYKKINAPEKTVSEMIENCGKKMHKILQPSAVYEIFDLELEAASESTLIKFADISLKSADLGRNLSGCKKIALFAATIGPQVDAMIRKAGMISQVESAVLQATGAMYIEQVVELLNNQLKKSAESLGYTAKPRYSPGYGDAGLEIQKEFFRLLPCSRIGLSLMDTLIMAPEKSVTAFVGFCKKKEPDNF